MFFLRPLRGSSLNPLKRFHPRHTWFIRNMSSKTAPDFKNYLRWDLDVDGLNGLTKELLEFGTKRCEEIAKLKDGEHTWQNTVMAFVHMESEVDTKSNSVTFPR